MEMLKTWQPWSSGRVWLHKPKASIFRAWKQPTQVVADHLLRRRDGGDSSPSGAFDSAHYLWSPRQHQRQAGMAVLRERPCLRAVPSGPNRGSFCSSLPGAWCAAHSRGPTLPPGGVPPTESSPDPREGWIPLPSCPWLSLPHRSVLKISPARPGRSTALVNMCPRPLL